VWKNLKGHVKKLKVFLEVVVSDGTKTGLGISRGGCERRYKDWAGNF